MRAISIVRIFSDKRRKDIHRLANVDVDETGIGSGDGVVPVEKHERDWMFVPILLISAFTITSLVIVLAVNIIKTRRGRSLINRNFPQIISRLESGKPSAAYEVCESGDCAPLILLGVHTGAVPRTNELIVSGGRCARRC